MNKINLLLWGNLVVVLGAANWIIRQKEDLIENGRLVLLEVTQYDPRSLMQGDYMQLRYPICDAIQKQLGEDPEATGTAVLGLDKDSVGTFRRLHKQGEALAEDEHLLHFKVRRRGWNSVQVAAESFFFQEGQGEEHARAGFAELRLDPNGHSLLVALRDKDRKLIGGRRR